MDVIAHSFVDDIPDWTENYKYDAAAYSASSSLTGGLSRQIFHCYSLVGRLRELSGECRSVSNVPTRSQ